MDCEHATTVAPSSTAGSVASPVGFLAAQVGENSDFSIENIPFGVGYIVFSSFTSRYRSPRCLTAIGDYAVDLSILQDAGAFDEVPDLDGNVFSLETLNSFLEHPPHVWRQVRQLLQDILSGKNDFLQSSSDLQAAVLHKMSAVQMIIPVHIGDYTDFYSSREHATNVGTMFRGKDNALQPNWLHLPVGYHGRSSTIFCSGQEIVRPHGQLQKDAHNPKTGSVYGTCKALDFELEVAFFVGGINREDTINGQPLTIQEAKERIFGFVLMNDWSARDIQKFEYVPLGPFTSKNFATTISPWIVTTSALEYFKVPTSAVTQHDPVPLEYLRDPDYSSYDIQLSVAIQSEKMAEPHTVCRSNFANLYWNAAQQLVHHSVTGCIMKVGDLLGSGTISGVNNDSFGSMLELSWNGKRSIALNSSGKGETRKFLQDGDTVIMRGFCSHQGRGRVGFGECLGKILPAGTVVQINSPLRNILKAFPANRYKDFKLYSFWKSSSCWRVRIALAAKKILHSTICVNIDNGEQRKEGFLKRNQMAQVPVFEYTDTTTGNVHSLTQSVAIIEFLDHIFSRSKPLFPRDPMNRIAAQEIVEIINAGIQPLQNQGTIQSLVESTINEEALNKFRRETIRKGLKAVQQCIKRHKTNVIGGPFAMGDFVPDVVDIFLVPQIFNARQCGINVDHEFAALAAIENACKCHPWFVDSHPLSQLDAPTMF